ncbi:MAG: recombinase family protein [Dehalococcoidia bacterium]
MRAIGYFRETEADSLSAQSEAFLDFCRGNGYEAAATFLDARGEDDLVGFRQMVDFVKQQASHGFLLVAIPNAASLGGAPTDAARRYFQLASLGVQTVSIEDGTDVSASLLEKWSDYRTNGGVGDKVKAGMRKRAITGAVLGRPPFGYKVGPNRRLVIVPEEGSIVRYIFRIYLKDGLGIRRVARRLNDEDLRTRRGGLWSMVTVRDILRNRAYIGTYSRFGVRVPASHAPLISPEDFQKVQDRLDQRRTTTGKRTVSPFLLSGIAHCAYCGYKMIGVSRKQKWTRRSDNSLRVAHYRYYQCESRTNRGLCDYHTRRAGDLEQEVREALARPRSIKGWQEQDPEEIAAQIQDQIRRLKDKVKRLDKRLEQHLDEAASGTIDQEKLRSLCVSLGAEQLRIEQKLAEAARRSEQEASEKETRRERQKKLKALRERWDELSFEEKQDLLRDVVEKIMVRDDGLELIGGS